MTSLGQKSQLKVFGLLCIVAGFIGLSAFCIEKGGHCILPIYVLIIAGFGIHPLIFACVLGLIIWLLIGVFSAQISSKMAIAFNSISTVVGYWWLISSREIALQFASLNFYVSSIVAFSLVQMLCFFWSLQLKSNSDVKYARIILTLFITLNLSWSFMTSFGIH
ncbi:MAG: hypothetical protein AAGB31_11295 [Bdellovibrio sp.]